MLNFKVDFSNPWLLLLLIPAIGVTLFLYFRISKKYRRTRNRIISMICHLLVTVLSVVTLAGISFSYEIPNKENEILILVDVSHSSREQENAKNEFVKSVINGSSSRFKVGVVTFGYDQVYAAELTKDTEDVYRDYINAPLPDNSATDLASALEYARGLFENPEAAKIVLISDGIETDGKAKTVIKSIAAEGIRVDTAYFESGRRGDEVQVVGFVPPEKKIIAGDEVELELTLQSSYEGPAYITVYDEEVADADVTSVTLTSDIQSVKVKHTFNEPGEHKLRFKIESDKDTLSQNNEYYAYINIEVFDKVLIIQRTDHESDQLQAVLEAKNKKVTVATVTDVQNIPSTLDGLRAYDQIILNNISAEDLYENLAEGFDKMLQSYVQDYGGGLFTVGGNKGYESDGVTPIPNAYNREDRIKYQDKSVYHQLLPVQAIEYTPPLAVVFVIDCSGSMDTKDSVTGKSLLELAKSGAMTAVDEQMSDRDYVGVISLDDKYGEEIAITPVTFKSKIIAAIDGLESGGGTVFTSSIKRAGLALKPVNVQRKHIILITDGQPGDEFEDYEQATKDNFAAGITMSIVCISGTGELSGAAAENMKNAALAGGGECHAVTDAPSIPRVVSQDLARDAIKEVEYGDFQPKINNASSSIVSGVTQADMPTLGGFYGTKLKTGAEAPIMGEYVPIYAQWKYGKGTVGSFMCDLSGTNWSANFLASDYGQIIVNNIVNTLFPSENIQPKEINYQFTEGNYSTQIDIFTELALDESIEVEITSPIKAGESEPQVQILKPSAESLYSRVTFSVTQPGVHQVVIRKVNMNGDVVASVTTQRVFSYSKEYDAFPDNAAAELLMTELAQDGKGAVLDDASEAFKDFARTIQKTYDPRLPFIIAALVLFLLDIAVRKFKFKWIHELVRDRKAKQAMGAK